MKSKKEFARVACAVGIAAALGVCGASSAWADGVGETPADEIFWYEDLA